MRMCARITAPISSSLERSFVIKSEIDVNVVRDFDCNYNKFRSTIAASWVGAWQLLPLQT